MVESSQFRPGVCDLCNTNLTKEGHISDFIVKIIMYVKGTVLSFLDSFILSELFLRKDVNEILKRLYLVLVGCSPPWENIEPR